ncbi:phosphodiesterase/alkaline phosphatase phoD [Pyrenophora tritici-repentis Pt-1C-BFP]|uniref:Phosphodiesterase/alkaline phosphatase phoD n=1 Tax=Pyrenophora tritici-repentis (strain Pt-1C-BFP) TaxID=426418 RepID=B2W9D7_PYRTR|nr:phosphodiesterase/alkaline phosphatase phoD [Pyrenophora tritici-repentis Pt-1C-BFP]EDU49515.1 phosphodiesterase/alkaline phosphatase phoD [Pyrenophora tritici-repentis Pt-1C-BFP]
MGQRQECQGDHGGYRDTRSLIEAKNLTPFTQYYYQFNVCGSSNKSPLGRTKTSPDEYDEVSKIGLAIFSCSNRQNGYFNAYGNAARKNNVDFFVHLGDYIYESAKGKLGQDPRATNPSREIITELESDNIAATPTFGSHTKVLHGSQPGMIMSFLNYRGISVDSRKMNAVRAYFEWMPLQEDWFYNQLSKSQERGATWRIIGNQIIFSRMNNSAVYSNWLNADQWDVSFAITGDLHANWVSDLVWLEETPYDQTTGAGAVGVEFAGTALLHHNISPEELNAQYFGSPSVASRNPFDVSPANFTVKAGANHLQRSNGTVVATDGHVESGALQRGPTMPTNTTLNTATGEWDVTGFEKMFVTYA